MTSTPTSTNTSAPATPTPQTLKLGRCGHQDPGHALGLRSGDILIAVEGQPWQGGQTALAARFAATRTPLLLSFLRHEVCLSLLVDGPDLGRWDQIIKPATPAAFPPPGPALCNWQIMVNHDGQHDLVALRPSLLALALPPLWLAQGRMFTWLAALAAAMALALPGGLFLLAGVWIAAGLHLWRHGTGHLIQTRQAEGYRPAGVLAARHEAEAKLGWLALQPGARFRFDSATALPNTTTGQTAT